MIGTRGIANSAAKKLKASVNGHYPQCITCGLSPTPDPLNICACCGSSKFIDTTEIHFNPTHQPALQVKLGRDSLKDSVYQR